MIVRMNSVSTCATRVVASVPTPINNYGFYIPQRKSAMSCVHAVVYYERGLLFTDTAAWHACTL